MFKKRNVAKATKSFWNWSKVTLGAEGIVFILVIAYIGVMKEAKSLLIDIIFFSCSFLLTVLLVWLRQEIAFKAAQAESLKRKTTPNTDAVMSIGSRQPDYQVGFDTMKAKTSRLAS